MVHYSVLLPQRDAGDLLGCLLPPLNQTLERLALPYELICIDDGSAPTTVAQLATLQHRHARLRVLRFGETRGMSAATTAGIQASRGRVLLALGSATLNLVRYVPELISRLSRWDLVLARGEQPLAAEWARSLMRVPRALLGVDGPGADQWCWGATREAVQGLALPRGAWNLVDAIVARRGYRVGHLCLAGGLPPQGFAHRAGWVEGLTARWLDRRFEPHLAREHTGAVVTHSELAGGRCDEPTTRAVPHLGLLPAEKEPHDTL